MKISHAGLVTDFSDEEKSQRKEMASRNDYPSSMFMFVSFVWHGFYYDDEICMTRR
jgi:hypothetical protein